MKETDTAADRTAAGTPRTGGREPLAEPPAGLDPERQADKDGGPQRGTRTDPRSENPAAKHLRPGASVAVGTPQAEDDPVVPGGRRLYRAAGGAGDEARTSGRQMDPAAGGAGDEARTFGRRMDRAVHDFVEDPRRAVREADAVLDDVIGRVQQALESRRQALREGSAAGADTEALRVALTRYRDLTGRLLTLAE